MQAAPIDRLPSISRRDYRRSAAEKAGRGGDGLYDDSVLTLAKELRSEGVMADYLHPPEERSPTRVGLSAGFMAHTILVGDSWGNKWGNMPHGFQPIST